MVVKVVDASALGALLFGEPQAQAVALELASAGLAAPALLPFEVANIAVKKIGQHPELRALVLTAFALSERMTIETIAVDQDAVVGWLPRQA
jgi:predicted nucleic acid-binding protein